MQPTEEVLTKYSDLLLGFSVNEGKGMNSGDKVRVRMGEAAKPLGLELTKGILDRGGFPIFTYLMDGFYSQLAHHASAEQLDYYPLSIEEAMFQEADHELLIIGTEVETSKLPIELHPRHSRQLSALNKRLRIRNKYEDEGNYTWSLALYPTEANAAEAGITLDEYWDEIINACYLDKEDPVREWRRIQEKNQLVAHTLSEMEIDRLGIETEHGILYVGIGPERKWESVSGHNMPSFEVYTSPDWRRVDGEVFQNVRVAKPGSVMEGVYLRFEDGIVVEARAQKGQEALDGLLAKENANRLGEISFTDKNDSRISRVLGFTLYDENIGGEFGNMHFALGNAYNLVRDAYEPIGEGGRIMRGYNNSDEHVDIVSTEDRVVRAILYDGSSRVIYENGSFTL